MPSITAFSCIGSNMLLAYRNLLFRSFDPIWLKDSKRYPFLVTFQIPPLTVMMYPKVQFSVPYCFFCTHSHFHRAVSHSEFADDSQLYNSVPREHLHSLIGNMQSCVADVKVWMTQNKLQLNNEKTEALLTDPQNLPNLPLSIVISTSKIQFSVSPESRHDFWWQALDETRS